MQTKRSWLTVAIAVLLITLMVGCSQSAPPAAAPTKAPAAPAATAAPAAPTAAPAAAVQPTAAPKAAAWPQKGKAITFIIPFSAGGSADLGSRLYASLLEKELGTPVEPVNKPGASTQVAMSELINAKPDGYTLGLTLIPSVLMPYLDVERKAGYDRKNFTPIASFGHGDNLPVTKGTSKIKNVKDLVDAARANPEKVKVGDSGLVSNTHLLTLGLGSEAGVKFASVHFGGAGESLTAVLGEHLDASMQAALDVLSGYKSGDVRLLAVAGAKRSKFFPDVPTLAEQGYKTSTSLLFGVSGPAGLPKEVVDVLVAATKKTSSDAALATKLNESGLEPDFRDPAGYTDFWAKSENTFAPLIEIAKKETK